MFHFMRTQDSTFFDMCNRYGSTFLLLLLLPISFHVLFAVVCIPSCALLSNVSFGSHGCSSVSCGIDCII